MDNCTEDGHLRLVGGRGDFEGRVELCYEGTWGTVCDNSWDARDAKVVCHQLGFNGTGALYPRFFFGPGNGPIYLDGANCTGSEERLMNCSRPYPIGEHDYFCSHGDDASVLCSAQGEESTW